MYLPKEVTVFLYRDDGRSTLVDRVKIIDAGTAGDDGEIGPSSDSLLGQMAREIVVKQRKATEDEANEFSIAVKR